MNQSTKPSGDDATLVAHRAFMDAFGGDSALAAHLGLRRQTVHQWRVRGIAWHWRARLVKMAAEVGILVPKDFFEITKPIEPAKPPVRPLHPRWNPEDIHDEPPEVA